MQKCCNVVSVSCNSSFKPSANGHLIFTIIAGLQMTPAPRKTILGSKNHQKIQKKATFEEENYKRHILLTFFLFFFFNNKRAWKNAQQQELKTCKSNLQKCSPHNSQNDHQQKSPQTIHAEVFLQNYVPSSCWWDVSW